MTAQYLKISRQIARQNPELDAYLAQIAAAQPAIDAAQTALDAATATASASQAALASLQSDASMQQAAWTNAQHVYADAVIRAESAPDAEALAAALSDQNAAAALMAAAESELTRLAPLIESAQATATADANTVSTAQSALQALTGPRDVLQGHADAIATSIAACQAALVATGVTMTPEEVAAYEAAQATQALIDSYTRALEAHYDATAQQRRYDNRYTCTVRAGYAGPFQAEGLAFAQWMDACNATAYQIMAAVQAGQRAMPASPAALVAEMPAIAWPG
jgi:chromosome segregation ATPase